MSEQKSAASSGKVSRLVLTWFAVVFLFLAWMAWLVLSAVSVRDGGAARSNRAGEMGDGPVFVLDGLQKKDTAAVPSPPFADSAEYVLAGAGLQGFYQTSEPDEVWTFSYPTPELAVQLVRRGPPAPRILTEGVKVFWSLDARTGPSKGSPARQGEMEAVQDSHFQVAIPVSAVRTDGVLDPYPVVTLRAEDEKTGKVLAESAAVLAVSPGFSCVHCHENGGTAILEVHDRHVYTNLRQRQAKGEVIVCRSCHGGAAAGRENPDGEKTDPQDGNGKKVAQGLSLSAAMHGWHAVYLPDRGADACMTCHVSLGRVGSNREAPPRPLFARDFHLERGLDCVRCHGFLEDHALALLKAEQESGKNQAGKAIASIVPRAAPLDKITARQAWVQEPDCASCHDFSQKPDPRTASAFGSWTDKKDGASALFSNRKDDMVMVRCITCHGAPHAAYQAENPLAPGLDNIPPIQYQRLAAPFGTSGNCAMCHGEPKDFFAHHPLVESK